jgi:hypothetical protein
MPMVIGSPNISTISISGLPIATETNSRSAFVGRARHSVRAAVSMVHGPACRGLPALPAARKKIVVWFR